MNMPTPKAETQAVRPAGRKAVRKKAVATPVARSPAQPPAMPVAKKAVAPKKAPVPNEPAEPTKPVAAAKPKAKLVRDSFTMPQVDFDLIATLKDRALGFKRPTKKSELLRAGLQVLASLSTDGLKAALDRLTPLKAGRPKKLA